MPSRLFALLRTAIVATLFVSLWAWFFPRWFAQGKGVKLAVVTWWPLVLMIVGGIIAFACVFDFAWHGRGTPAPFDPPRRLVVRGFYRWVRNPMYIGFGIFLFGEGLMFAMILREMIYLIVALWLAVSIFIVAYEEPTLRSLFGDDYIEYCKNVRRWIPRLTPWYPAPHLD